MSVHGREKRRERRGRRKRREKRRGRDFFHSNIYRVFALAQNAFDKILYKFYLCFSFCEHFLNVKISIKFSTKTHHISSQHVKLVHYGESFVASPRLRQRTSSRPLNSTQMIKMDKICEAWNAVQPFYTTTIRIPIHMQILHIYSHCDCVRSSW